MAEQKETKNPVQSAERIFQVMEMLADHGEMGLMEISTALGLHKSTVHRLLLRIFQRKYLPVSRKRWKKVFRLEMWLMAIR